MKKRKFARRVFLAAAALFFSVLAAGEKASAEAADNVTKGETLYSVTDSGVSVTLETDKAEYRAGEEIRYTITIKNDRANWNIKAFAIDYRNTDGLLPADGAPLPGEVPDIVSGESYVISGALVGDPQRFVDAGDASGSIGPAGIVIAIVVVVLAAAAFLILRKKKKKGTAAVCLFLAAAILALDVLPAEAADEAVTLRPYLKVNYAGEEVMIRAVMEIPMIQQRLVIESGDRMTYKKITCHDPSIFRDHDGTYYIIGSFLAGGSTTNLYDWTSLDGQIQGSFTQEVRDQIRAWNKDERAGSWNGYLWAPDIVYNPHMEKYCMYLSANGDDWKSNIVLLTADAVTGPYDYAGTIVYGGFTADTYGETDAPAVLGENEIPERYVKNGIANRKWGDMWPNCIDPCTFFDSEGNLWMSYGSWSGGIFMLALDEETGLRDYSVTYETNLHSDAYFGKKIAGGAYVSGEASYIQKIGDYYYLFISYGNLEAKGGYNIRVYRSGRPDGDYVDMLGNTPYFDSYVFNYNLSTGVRLMGGYKWRNLNYGQVAQGHNSAFVDEDGRAYIVFHTRTNDGTEGHFVKVHQLFVTKEGWIVAAPYQTTGESLKNGGYTAAQIAGNYEVILHELDIDYGALEVKKPGNITLHEDGRITGDYEGTWSAEAGTSYVVLHMNGQDYSGVALSMKIENTKLETMVFTAVGLSDQVTLWGSRTIE